ncbi:deacylase [Caballeronia choica]|uniref:Lipid A deacylase n=2 Tax=Caballeronia choica TaxID=326476 RepID=A0A158G0Y8_9BURK|nr:deacylase [Caballeronia choica]
MSRRLHERSAIVKPVTGLYMQKKKSAWLIRSLRSTLLAACALASATANADRFGVQVGAGVADRDMKKVDLGAVWDPNWTWWEIAGFHFTVVGEGHVSYWHSYEDQTVNPNILEIGVTPVLRFVKSAGYIRPFIEAGVGIRLLSHTRITETFSVGSVFQFADMVGIGAIFGAHQNYQAGFRFQHLSNGGIKEPNPGINFSQLYLQYNF